MSNDNDDEALIDAITMGDAALESLIKDLFATYTVMILNSINELKGRVTHIKKDVTTLVQLCNMNSFPTVALLTQSPTPVDPPTVPTSPTDVDTIPNIPIDVANPRIDLMDLSIDLSLILCLRHITFMFLCLSNIVLVFLLFDDYISYIFIHHVVFIVYLANSFG